MGLEYRQFAPSGIAVHYVECYWTLDGEASATAKPERILPDGRPELVLNLGDPFLRHGPGESSRRQAPSLLVGQITTPILLQPTGAIALVAIRFRPAALGAFLNGLSAHEVTDLDLAVDALLGARWSTLAEAASAAPTAEARISIVEAHLCEYLRRSAPTDRRVAAAVHALSRSSGTARIEGVAAEVGVSARQLERLFLAEVGIGPKRFARISRFQHLLSRLGSAAQPGGWARIAMRCGYYDQAHLIRDFRELAGSSPASFALGGDDRLAEVFLGDR